MKKLLAAIVALLVAAIGVISAKSNGLITDEFVGNFWFGLWYSVLAVILSWVLTAFMGSRHKAWAMGSAGGLMLIGGLYRWGAHVPVGWIAVSLIFAVASPFLFMVSEAILGKYGIKLRKGEYGEVIGVKVDDDATIWVGSATAEDLQRNSTVPGDPTVPKDKPSDE